MPLSNATLLFPYKFAHIQLKSPFLLNELNAPYALNYLYTFSFQL